MKKFLAALVEAKDMVDVNIAAGLALEQQEKTDGPGAGQVRPEARKAI